MYVKKNGVLIKMTSTDTPQMKSHGVLTPQLDVTHVKQKGILEQIIRTTATLSLTQYGDKGLSASDSTWYELSAKAFYSRVSNSDPNVATTLTCAITRIPYDTDYLYVIKNVGGSLYTRGVGSDTNPIVFDLRDAYIDMATNSLTIMSELGVVDPGIPKTFSTSDTDIYVKSSNRGGGYNSHSVRLRAWYTDVVIYIQLYVSSYGEEDDTAIVGGTVAIEDPIIEIVRK